MDTAPTTQLLALLAELAQSECEFLVVGGLAALLAGAPIATFDADILIRNSDETRRRLLSSLERLQARYLDPAGRDIRPSLEKLETLRLHRLVSPLGPFDVLTSIGHGRRYEDLVAESSWVELSEGLGVRVLDLAAVIRTKEEANRDKDRATLGLLKRALELRGRREPA